MDQQNNNGSNSGTSHSFDSDPTADLPLSVASMESTDLVATEGMTGLAASSGSQAAATAQRRAHARLAAQAIMGHPDWDSVAIARHLSGRLGISLDAATELLTCQETSSAAADLRALTLHSLAADAATAWREEMQNLGEMAADVGVDASVRVKASGKRLDAASAILTSLPTAGQSAPSSGPTTINVVGSVISDGRSLPPLPKHPGQD